MTQRNRVLKLLHKFKDFLGGTIGTWKIDTVNFELKQDPKTIYLRPFPVPKVHHEMFENEVKFLVPLGVIELENDSEW